MSKQIKELMKVRKNERVKDWNRVKETKKNKERVHELINELIINKWKNK